MKNPSAWAALITNGDMADANFELIEAAKKEIYLVEFLVRDDEFGLMKLALLRKKAREGIKVHLHVDAFHLLVQPALVKHLIDEGIDFTVFNELSFSRLNRVTSRNHCKILIIDSYWLKMGDANTGNEYVHWGTGHHMKSIDVIIKGKMSFEVRKFARLLIQSPLSKAPEVEIGSTAEVQAQRLQMNNLKQMAKTVFELLQIQMDAPDQFTRPQKVFVTEQELRASINALDQAEKRVIDRLQSRKLRGPYVWHKHPLANTAMKFHADPVSKSAGKTPRKVGVSLAIHRFVRDAKSEIAIVTPYLLLTDDMRATLNSALAKNISVSVYTNSLKTTDNVTTQMAYEYRLEEVASIVGLPEGQTGLRIFEYQGAETLHAKFILRDNQDCMVMTYNLDWRSELLNLETAVEFSSLKLTEDLKTWLQHHKSDFLLVAESGRVLKDSPEIAMKGDIVKRLIIQAIEKQL